MDIKIKAEDVTAGTIFHLTNASGRKMVSTITGITEDGRVIYTLLGAHVTSLKEVDTRTVKMFVESYNGPTIHVNKVIYRRDLKLDDDLFDL